jgi:hypothetical protein
MRLLLTFTLLFEFFTSPSETISQPARDSDGDGIPDAIELSLGLDPYNPADGLSDEDEDGLSWADEWRQGTQAKTSDSDGDGVSDGDEVKLWGTNPLFRNALSDFPVKRNTAVVGPTKSTPSLSLARQFTPRSFSDNWSGSKLIPIGDWTLERQKLRDYLGWMPKHGRSLKVWREGQREVVELDAQPGDSFGMMRRYPNPSAGTYVLLWDDSVRAGVASTSARYHVKIMGDTTNVLGQQKGDPIAGTWRSQSLVFTIPPTMVPAQLWIHFEVEDNDGEGAFIQQVRLLRLSVELDVNRDGRIEKDEHPKGRVWEFWVNDDYDREHVVDENDIEEDDLGILETVNLLPDWKSDKINSGRDLEDFFRLQLSLEGDVDGFAEGDLWLGLKFKVSSQSANKPSLKMFKILDQNTAAYLQDEVAAQKQVKQGWVIQDLNPMTKGGTLLDADHAFVLPKVFFNGVNRTVTVLAEACTEGEAMLNLIVMRRRGANFEPLAEVPSVDFCLSNIKKRYEHWSAGNENGGTPLNQPVRLTGTLFKNVNGGRVMSDKSCLVFIHGWNMETWEKERYAETAFKRLWWMGFDGDLALFSWPCTNGLNSNLDVIKSPTNYDLGEYVAWQSAECLRLLLEDLRVRYSGQVYLLAHSMGNIVASEALRLQTLKQGGALAKVYFASQAALSAHCYDGTLNENSESKYAVIWNCPLPKLDWLGKFNFGPDTPNVYRSWFADLLNKPSPVVPVVGKIFNLYNQNDWALSDDIWCYNQITKPDWIDRPYQLWHYDYIKNTPKKTEEPFAQGFERSQGRNIQALTWGLASSLKDNYEIMAFAAESRVRALGACDVSKGVTASVDLEKFWPEDRKNHATHKWHSAQFRSILSRQRMYWSYLKSAMSQK